MHRPAPPASDKGWPCGTNPSSSGPEETLLSFPTYSIQCDGVIPPLKGRPPRLPASVRRRNRARPDRNLWPVPDPRPLDVRVQYERPRQSPYQQTNILGVLQRRRDYERGKKLRGERTRIGRER